MVAIHQAKCIHGFGEILLIDFELIERHMSILMLFPETDGDEIYEFSEILSVLTIEAYQQFTLLVSRVVEVHLEEMSRISEQGPCASPPILAANPPNAFSSTALSITWVSLPVELNLFIRYDAMIEMASTPVPVTPPPRSFERRDRTRSSSSLQTSSASRCATRERQKIKDRQILSLAGCRRIGAAAACGSVSRFEQIADSAGSVDFAALCTAAPAGLAGWLDRNY